MESENSPRRAGSPWTRPPVRSPRGPEGERSVPSPSPEDPPEQGLTLERVMRFLGSAAVVGVAAWILWYFVGLVAYLVVGGVLAYLMRPVVHRVQGLGLGRLPAVLVTFVGAIGLLILLVVWLAPFAVQQISALSQQVSVEAIAGGVRTLEDRLIEVFPVIEQGTLVESLRDISDTLFRGEQLRTTFSSVVTIFTDIFYAVLAIPFVAFFVLKDGAKLRKSVLEWVPNQYFEVTLAIVDKVETTLGRYLRGLLMQCSAVGAVAAVLLSLAGLDYAVAVGVFAGLANSIPYFGPLVGFLAGSLVGIAQTGDFSLVFPVLVAMALTQITDNVFFQPLIFSKVAQAHPIVILFVVLIGAQLGGIIGMLVAIPLMTTLRVVVMQVLWSVRNYRILRT